MNIQYKMIDYAMESEDNLNSILHIIPEDIDILSYIARQLIINQKCLTVFEEIYKKIIIEVEDKNFIKNNVSVLSSALISKNINFYNIIIENLNSLPYEIKKPILEQSLQNNCNIMDAERLTMFLNIIPDVAFKNNIIYYLMKNNQNTNIQIIKARPEVIHVAYQVYPDSDVTDDIDMNKFYEKYPEMLLY